MKTIFQSINSVSEYLFISLFSSIISVFIAQYKMVNGDSIVLADDGLVILIDTFFHEITIYFVNISNTLSSKMSI